MKIDVLTLFPQMFMPVLGESVIGRAMENKLLDFNFINIRDFSENKHNKVDDTPYGGGAGMVMAPQPVISAYRSITENLAYKPYTVYLSPQGKTFNQEKAKEMATLSHIVLLCGHYEGIDERIIEEIVDEEISVGDFVLTGGEIPALTVIDAVSRLIPGVLGDENSFADDSFYNSLLEYPQYTRPYDYNGKKVPEVLISGNHKNIDEWRREQSLIRTYKKRPDLLEKANLSEKDIKFLKNLKK